MRRPGFTLIELLVVVAIIGTMVTIGVLSVRQGQGVARLRGTARDLLATVRRARSVAMTSEEPSIITYSTESVDGEACAKVEIVSSKKLGGQSASRAETLGGEVVSLEGDDSPYGDDGDSSSFQGMTAGDVLFRGISDDVLRGVRLKVEHAGEEDDEPLRAGRKRSNISIFSNVDYLLGRYEDAKAEAERKKKDAAAADGEAAPASEADVEPLQEPVQFVWQVNGRCDPHRIWVYLDGTERESGLVIDVDMFGAAKILTPDELEGR